MRRGLIGAMLMMSVSVGTARADDLQVLAAGSLTAAFTELLHRFPAGQDSIAPPKFSSSGLLRQRIEAGETVDLFASADMTQPRALAAGHPERLVINFTRNQLCALATPAVGLTTENMLDRLLDPNVRVATSTPVADPGGDYAWAVFARAEALHPGAKAALESKALPLVGGGDKTPLLVPGKGAVEGIFLANKADVMLGYCSSAGDVQRSIPSLVNVHLPANLSVETPYGMVLMTDKPVTYRFAAYVMSEAGQSVLRAHGFVPTAQAEAAPPVRGVLVHRQGKADHVLSPEQLAAIKPFTQHVEMTSEHGKTASDWTGPSLWDVVVASGAVDPAKPAEQVRLSMRVTGADGYVAVLALAEISPVFSDHKVQLADHENGVALPNGAWRLLVPDEHRGGRSVRDVIRIDIVN